MPNRTRWYSPVPSELRDDFSPLCPLSPPPSLSRRAPNGRSSSSWTTTSRSSGTLKKSSSAVTGPPDSFMYERGFASTTPLAGQAALDDLGARLVRLEACRHPVGQQVRTMKPTLCRLPAYAGPGLPSPTTSHVPSDSSAAGSRLRRGLAGSALGLLALGSAGLARLGALAVAVGRGRRLGFAACSSSVGSCSMPTSASASASSASICLGRRWRRVTLTTRRPRSVTSWRRRQRRCPWRGSGCRPSGPRRRHSTPSGCAWPRPRPVRVCSSVVEQAAGGDLATTWTGSRR